MPTGDDDLAERIADLERTLEELRAELRTPPRGPLGLPRPPTPRELLRVADEYAIPAVIAVLEANVRALELLQRVLRLTDPARADDAARGATSATRERAERASGVALDRLDDVLADLQRAYEEGSLPTDPEARRILTDARRLTEDVQRRLEAPDPGVGAADDDLEESGVRIDVEEELRTIKDQVGERDDGDDRDDADDAAGSDR